MVSALALLSLAAFGALELDLEALVLLTTGAFSLVYLVGTAAAVRLLPRRTWAHRAALGALLAVVALLVLTGAYVVWALALGRGGPGLRRVRQPDPPRVVRTW